MTEEREDFMNWHLFGKLLYVTSLLLLTGSFVNFIIQGNLTPAILCFLTLVVISGIKSLLAHLIHISAMVEAGVKRVFMGDIMGRPNPGQIDRLLGCSCDKCKALRERFGLIDRVGQASLLTDEEKQEEEEALEN